MKLGLCLNSRLCSLTRYLSIFRNTKIRTVYWDKPVDFDGRLIFAPMEAHRFMMGASWVTIRDRAFAAAASSINDPLNGRRISFRAPLEAPAGSRQHSFRMNRCGNPS